MNRLQEHGYKVSVLDAPNLDEIYYSDTLSDSLFFSCLWPPSPILFDELLPRLNYYE